MVKLTENSLQNQPRSNKRPFSNDESNHNPRGGKLKKNFNDCSSSSKSNIKKGLQNGKKSSNSKSGEDGVLNRSPANQKEEASSKSQKKLKASSKKPQNESNKNSSKEEPEISNKNEDETSSESEEEVETQINNLQHQDGTQNDVDNTNTEDGSSGNEEKEGNENRNNSTQPVVFRDDVEIDYDSKAALRIFFLPVSMTKPHIKQFFQRYGKVIGVAISSPGRHFVTAVVVFDSRETATKALEINGMYFENKRLVARLNDQGWNIKKSIVVSHIPSDIRSYDWSSAFEESCGPFTRYSRLSTSNEATIEFEHEESKELALAMKTFSFRNHILQIKPCVGTPEMEKRLRHKPKMSRPHHEQPSFHGRKNFRSPWPSHPGFDPVFYNGMPWVAHPYPYKQNYWFPQY